MQTLLMGFTPDPDDAFAAYALVHGKVPTRGWSVRIQPGPIETLNRRAAAGELDIAAISSVFYPRIRDRYAILRCGASVGRGYGPVLAARNPLSPQDLVGRPVAVPGETTTGANLLALFVPGTATVPMKHREIREAVARGDVDAGVLIHEELLNYSETRLCKILCLGAEWHRRTALPLPVGLTVVRRDLGAELAGAVAESVRDSILYAIEHAGEAFAWARRFGSSPSSGAVWKFTRMFVNDDTVHFGLDCERGLRELFHRLSRAHLVPAGAEVSFVEPAARVASGASTCDSVEGVPESR